MYVMCMLRHVTCHVIYVSMYVGTYRIKQSFIEKNIKHLYLFILSSCVVKFNNYK